MALTLSKLFMRKISQNPNENQTGISLWTLEDIEKAQAKQKELADKAWQLVTDLYVKLESAIRSPSERSDFKQPWKS